MGIGTVVELVESERIPQDPAAPAVLVAVLSLVVPGLGQAWLGQWARGLRVFSGSATLCFGLGFANLLAAYDAYSLGKRNQREDITARTASKTLLVFAALWAGVCLVLDGVVDFLLGAQSVVLLLVATPLMLVSKLAGGKGFRW